MAAQPSHNVLLEPYEIRVAEYIGRARFDYSKRRDSNTMSTDVLGFDNDEAHRVGAIAELAFAKWAGIYWDFSTNTFKTHPDVGRYAIRAKHYKYRHGELIIRPSDLQHEAAVPFVLLTPLHESLREWHIVGWLQPRDVRQEWWSDRGKDRGLPPAYFVPQHALKPFKRRANSHP